MFSDYMKKKTVFFWKKDLGTSVKLLSKWTYPLNPNYDVNRSTMSFDKELLVTTYKTLKLEADNENYDIDYLYIQYMISNMGRIPPILFGDH